MDLVSLFCEIDDFVKSLESTGNNFYLGNEKSRGKKSNLSLSEIMTILIKYHDSGFKNFKTFYLSFLSSNRSEFPDLVSYNRFIELIPSALFPLAAYLKTRMGKNTGIAFIDSTPLSVCHNIRISRNKVFKEIATRGKSSMGWFYGFKLHLVVNHQGELLSFKITKGNVNDRDPVNELCENITGKLFGDKGYLGKELFEKLLKKGLKLVTNLKSNMKNKLISLNEKSLLKKRFIIETINGQLKNICDIDHTRHRSPVNFLVNIISGLISYTWKNKKPCIKMSKKVIKALCY